MSVIRSRPSSLILLESSNAPQVYVLDQHHPAILDIHAGKRLSSKTERFYFHLRRREECRREAASRRSLLLAPAQPQLSATTATTGIQSLLFPPINPAETGITTPPSSPALDKPVLSLPPLYQKVVVPAPTPTPTPILVHTCAPSPALAPTGRVLNVADFDIHEKLGQGGFGIVYRATDKMTGVELALKIMPKKSSRFRFVQDEHHAMRAIEGMPGFVQLYASWHDTVNYYLAMQFVPYGDVKHKVTFRNPIPVGCARIWMAELLVLLSELHAKGLVHRDIKPDNLLIDCKGYIVLADFGLTRDFKIIPYDIHPSDPRAPAVLPRSPYAAGETPFGFSHQRYGTPQYFAPELHLGWAYSYGADIWSAGVTLFFMVFGRIPFNSADIKSVGNAIINKPLRFTHAELHWDEFTDVRDLLARMLAKDPAERPSVEEIKAHPFFSTINWKAMAAHHGPSAWKRPLLPRPRPNTSERAAIPFPYGKSYAQDEDPWPAFTFTAATLQAKTPYSSTFTCVRRFFSRTFELKSTQSARPVPSAGNTTSSRSLQRVAIAIACHGEVPTGDICDEVRTMSWVPKMKDCVGERRRVQVKWFR